MGIRDFFSGKNIFITGATGFLGKILIEKLLRSCPEVGNIYVLIRGKRGKSPSERLEGVLKDDLFDKLRETYPENTKKVIAIGGDVCLLGLGINEQDRQTLKENVNVIFHMAASVRFDDSLQDAVFTNIRSTRELIELAKEMTKFFVFVHVSTAYSNCDRLHIEEKIYPSHGDWKEAIRVAEQGDSRYVEAMTQKYIYPHPNTYTYTKSLAEKAVEELCIGYIPAIIVRPSIVTAAIMDPIPGWTDNLNGPGGLLAAGAKGILRTMLGEPDAELDYVAVDIVGRLLIIAGFEKGNSSNSDTVEVYNMSQYDKMLVSVRDLTTLGVKTNNECPVSQMVWFNSPTSTDNFYVYYFLVIFYHMIPAIFLDMLLRIAGQKPRLFTLQTKIYVVNTVLLFFMSNRFKFTNENAFKLLRNTAPEDRADFGIQAVENHFKNLYEYMLVGKKYMMTRLFKEDFSDMDRNRKIHWRMWALNHVFRIVFIITLLWYVFIKHDTIQYMANSVTNYFERL